MGMSTLTASWLKKEPTTSSFECKLNFKCKWLIWSRKKRRKTLLLNCHHLLPLTIDQIFPSHFNGSNMLKVRTFWNGFGGFPLVKKERTSKWSLTGELRIRRKCSTCLWMFSQAWDSFSMTDWCWSLDEVKKNKMLSSSTIHQLLLILMIPPNPLIVASAFCS